jgi:predicted nucleotidyltransferase
MLKQNQILQQIKTAVHAAEPCATVVLYGSYARGDENSDSDFDLLILVDKEKISSADVKRLAFPLYDIEFETGKIISPLVISRKKWETQHRITPFYKNVQKEGVVL